MRRMLQMKGKTTEKDIKVSIKGVIHVKCIGSRKGEFMHLKSMTERS